jgi:thiazolinyl imide reductase
MPDNGQPLSVVVCGTIFGQVYLEALRRSKYPLKLAGILGRGSARTAACADYYGVPLFTCVEQIPPEVEAACVVVRSRLLGGKGTELAQALMRRGIHVLQEHPMHPDEMAESLRLARAQRVNYRLNFFYSNLGPVRRFIGAARELCLSQRPLFVDAACGCQLSCSLLDIIGMCLGRLRPVTLQPLADNRSGTPFVIVKALFSDVPVMLRVQNQLDPADPDGFSQFLHQITIAFEQGSLSLVDTHGPVVWIPKPQYPQEVRFDDASPRFMLGPMATPRVVIVGSANAPSYDEAFRILWPNGIQRALLKLRTAIRTREDGSPTAQYQLMICEVWRDVLAQIGPPDLVRGRSPSTLSAETLSTMVRAAAAMEDMP